MIEHITRIDDPKSIKKILDAFVEHRKEVEKNAPHCDYSPVEKTVLGSGRRINKVQNLR